MRPPCFSCCRSTHQDWCTVERGISQAVDVSWACRCATRSWGVCAAAASAARLISSMYSACWLRNACGIMLCFGTKNCRASADICAIANGVTAL
jgi:hypothetical protein